MGNHCGPPFPLDLNSSTTISEVKILGRSEGKCSERLRCVLTTTGTFGWPGSLSGLETVLRIALPEELHCLKNQCKCQILRNRQQKVLVE